MRRKTMDKLQWFKFAPSDWMMGKIMRCDEITQARYMRLVCLYWNKECNLSYEDAEIEIDKDHLDILIKKKIVKLDEDFIYIEFLDEQMEGISETSEKRRAAVKKRWDKVKQNNTRVLQNDTSVLQSDTEESRVEEKREDKSIKKEILNSNIWIEQIAMQKRENVKRIETLLNTFLNDLELQGEIDKGEKEIKKHFINWLNIELKKPKETKKDSFSFSKS